MEERRKLLDFIKKNLKSCNYLGDVDGRNILKRA
jgi:hypothetical protein